MYKWKELLKDLSGDAFECLRVIIGVLFVVSWAITGCGFILLIIIFLPGTTSVYIYLLAGIYLLTNIIIVAIDVNDYLKKYKPNPKEEE